MADRIRVPHIQSTNYGRLTGTVVKQTANYQEDWTLLTSISISVSISISISWYLCDVGSTAHPDPRTYYEHVQPSDWRPEHPDTCIELHRKAYCGHGDAAFPFLYFAILSSLCYWHLLPFWGICLVVLPLFVLGMQLLVFKGKPCCDYSFVPFKLYIYVLHSISTSTWGQLDHPVWIRSTTYIIMLLSLQTRW